MKIYNPSGKWVGEVFQGKIRIYEPGIDWPRCLKNVRTSFLGIKFKRSLKHVLRNLRKNGYIIGDKPKGK